MDMNFYQTQLFEYVVHCYNEFAERDQNNARKITPIFKDNSGIFTGSTLSFNGSSLSILYVKSFEKLEVGIHTTDRNAESSEPFFAVRGFVFEFLSKLKNGNDVLYLNPELLISVFENYVLSVDTSGLEKLPKIWRNYHNLNSNIKLANYVSESDNFNIVSLTRSVENSD